MEAWTNALMKASPKSYSETFGDQVHGWMASRLVFSSLFAGQVLEEGVGKGGKGSG